MNKKYILAFIVIVIAGSLGYFLLTKNSYEWNSLEDKAQYADVSWNRITHSRLDGFVPRLAIRENKTEPCKASINDAAYLRREGGMCKTGYWLEVKNSSSTEKIDSPAKLRETFGPIDSESEAASFVAVITPDLKVGSNDVIEGYTSTVRDGYWVQVVQNNTFGCGNHKPTRVIYKVLKSGNISPVAFEKPGSVSNPLCVD